MSSLDSSAFESNEEEYLARLELKHRKLTKRQSSQLNRNNSNNDSGSDNEGDQDKGNDEAKLSNRFKEIEDSEPEDKPEDIEEKTGLPIAVY